MDYKNYKKEITDSLNPMDYFELNGFYISGSKYWTIEIKGNTKNKVELSNFVGESHFHLINGTNNSKRIVKIQRHTGELAIIEIQSSEMKLEPFETILKSNRCTFYGNNNQLKKIFANWMDNEVQAHVIDTLGYNHEHNMYAFSNAVYTNSGKLLTVSDIGIIEDLDNKEKYYLPAFGLAHLNNLDYDDERKFIFIEGDLSFEQWAKLYFDAFESNGAIAMSFLILSVFWDIVFSQVGFFPFLFLFGAFGTGKTTLVENLLRPFGKDYIGISLNNATKVALSRTIASRNNSIFYLKEYTNETDHANQDLILTAYDGSGRSTGVKSNDNKTRKANVKSAIIFDGNELPTQKTAVLSRMILLNFENNTFSQKQLDAFNQLEKHQKKGFGNVLADILKHREYFRLNFKNIFDEILKELKTSNKCDFAERTLKHVTLMLTPAKLLSNKLKFPFSFDEIQSAVLSNSIEQNMLLEQTNDVVIFWTAFDWAVKNGNLIEFKRDSLGDNKKQAHYNFKKHETSETILQIKLPNIFSEYVKYCRNNNQRSLDVNSLRMLLTSKANTTFIPNQQKGRGAAYTDFYFGTCYQFRLEKSENDYSINGVEINM